jgi:hypothetical protein
MRRRDVVAATLGALAATVLAGSVAWAAIPSDGGAYTACTLKNVGTVRVVPGGASGQIPMGTPTVCIG